MPLARPRHLFTDDSKLAARSRWYRCYSVDKLKVELDAGRPRCSLQRYAAHCFAATRHPRDSLLFGNARQTLPVWFCCSLQAPLMRRDTNSTAFRFRKALPLHPSSCKRRSRPPCRLPLARVGSAVTQSTRYKLKLDAGRLGRQHFSLNLFCCLLDLLNAAC